jgi:hypothetical protein
VAKRYRIPQAECKRLRSCGLFKAFDIYRDRLHDTGDPVSAREALSEARSVFRPLIKKVEAGDNPADVLKSLGIGLERHAEPTGDPEYGKRTDGRSARKGCPPGWPAGWSLFKPSDFGGRSSTLAEDALWVYDHLLFRLKDIDPLSAPSAGAVNWLFRIKRSPETMDKFYTSVLVRFLHSKSQDDDDAKQQDKNVFRLLGKVEEASRKARALQEAGDAREDAPLPSGAEGYPGKPGVPSGHVGVGG